MPLRRAALVPCLLLAALAAGAAPISPAQLRHRGYVNDFAEVVGRQWEERLTLLTTQLDQKTKAQIAVVTLSSLEGEPIEDFANRLFAAWKIGHQDDRGLLLLLVIKDRRSRLEVGYGLEPIIPDGFSGSVLREMRPALREQKYGEALYAGALVLAERIAAQSGVKLDVAALPQRGAARAPQPDWLALALLLIAVGGLASLPLWMPGRSGFGRRRRWSYGGGLGGFGGFGGYDVGGSSGGFGGFGGGASGGGGASSNW